jgi:hypothetical protein
VDLARLGVDKVCLDPVAVPSKQGVGEGAVAPKDPATMEVYQERSHRIEQPLTVWPRTEWEAHQQAPVLDRIREVLGGEDRLVAYLLLGQADRGHRRETGQLEATKDLELLLGDASRLLLECERAPVHDDEANQVTRGPDRQVAKRVGARGPCREWLLPREVKQARADVPEAELREAGGGLLARQSFFRR